MKIQWEESDVKVGRMVVKDPRRQIEKVEPSWLATVTYIIGYTPFSGIDKPQTCLISLCDGMVTRPETDMSMAGHLTKGGYIPMPRKWLGIVMEELRNTHAE